jgi:dihydroorotate dehydrogenase (fumarate)
MLRPHLSCSLAATTGIHTAKDVIKMVLAGADVAMMASVLLYKGPRVLESILSEMKIWMEEKEYTSLEEMKGAMSSLSVADPGVFERANYIKALQGFDLDEVK